MTIEAEDAYAGGDAARFYGEPISENPHPKDTLAHRWWNTGWIERDEEMSTVSSSTPQEKP